jgi:hypothetical protein
MPKKFSFLCLLILLTVHLQLSSKIKSHLISFSDKVSFKIISDPELPGSGMIFQGPDPAISFGTGSTTLYLTKGSGSGRSENLRIRSGYGTLMKTAVHRKEALKLQKSN